MWATARPRRTIVILSPLCSTASSSSAKFRAALVALISVTRSDYQILVSEARIDSSATTHWQLEPETFWWVSKARHDSSSTTHWRLL